MMIQRQKEKKEMNNLFKKIITGDNVYPTKECVDAFNENFSNAKNVEWHNRKTYYEAVFYKDKIEHIANFTLSGDLIEYKKFLPADYLPAPIKEQALSRGEIMSSVLKNKGNALRYELIIRDFEKKRFVIIFTDIGEVIEVRKL